MIKTGLITLLAIIGLVILRSIYARHSGSRKGDWVMSCLAIILFIVALLNANISVSTYLTRFVKPLSHFIFGGA
ncbi:hypothetical protein A3842_27975 [Paenibacillus sp. P3E]|uniref:hypothetical protein n=1 Tax=Paenibacillus sp. P3E TaxID=1349435 RepID=UPI00093E0237|nr:hypothetical protein [Paenibacillus sp. P3E]OKP67716.1 hypothetical protein A3842_27975 [Paenibacillus sp. P3E]